MAEGALPAEIIDDAPPPRLTAQQAEELLRRVADLTKARTDLPRGLRASAESCNQPRLAEALRRVADQVEQGRGPESALGRADWALPPHVAGLVAAAMSSGNCGLVLTEIADMRSRQDDAQRELRQAVAYPLLVMVLSAITAVFLLNLLGPYVQALYAEFELELPAATSSLIWFVNTGQWAAGAWLIVLMVLVAGFRLAGPWPLWCRARIALPVLGKTYLWSGVIEALRLVRLLVAQGVPLPQGWRLAAAGLRDGHMAQVAQRVARSLEQGQSLAAALREEPATFPPTLIPLIAVAERTGDLPGSLESAAEILDERLRARTALIRDLAPPIMFLLIATMVLSIPAALMLPLTSLIQGLSGSIARGRGGGASAILDLGHTFNLLWLFPLAFALSFSRRLIYGDRRPGTSTWLEMLLWSVEISAWGFALAGYLLFAQWGFAIPLAIVAAYIILESYFRHYRSECETLLRSIALSAQRHVPLTDAAWARYQERSDRLGRRCARLAEHLAAGLTLPWSLYRAHITLPYAQQAVVEAAAATGDLGGTLSDSLQRASSARRDLAAIAGKISYLAWVTLVMIGILTFVMLKIVPVFAMMFYEFDLELPGPTLTLVNFSNFLVAKWWLLALLLFVVSIAVTISFEETMFRVAAWLFPVLHWFRLRQYGAWLLHALATLVRHRQPIEPAIALMAGRYPIYSVGRRLQRASDQIASGQPWPDALRRFGFISAYDAAFLAAAQRNGHLAWALDEAAANMERRRLMRLQYRANLVFPVAIVMLGMITAFVVISLFMPLIALIQGLSGVR